MTTKRNAINYVYGVQGPLYSVGQTEDGEELVCYDWTFRAVDIDGRTWEHKSHSVRGAIRNEEGFMQVNRMHRREADAFVARVEARGSIDPAHWEQVDLEAQARAQAAELAPFGAEWERDAQERYEATGRYL